MRGGRKSGVGAGTHTRMGQTTRKKQVDYLLPLCIKEHPNHSVTATDTDMLMPVT